MNAFDEVEKGIQYVLDNRTSYRVAKDLDIQNRTINRYQNGETPLENMSLKTAKLIYNYYKELNKMKKVKVFKVDNGEVFLEHNLNRLGSKASKQEVEQVINKAKELLNNGEYEKVTCEIESGVKSYYDTQKKFIGNAGIHVKDRYSEFQELIYLVRDDESELEKVVNQDRIFK